MATAVVMVAASRRIPSAPRVAVGGAVGGGLHHACRVGDVGDMERLLLLEEGKGSGDPLLHRDHLMRTPLHVAAWAGRRDVVEWILERGRSNRTAVQAVVAACAQDGTTALHFAAQKGHGEIAQLLLDYGADVYAKTRKG